MTKDKIIEDYLAREDRYEAFFDIIASHLKSGRDVVAVNPEEEWFVMGVKEKDIGLFTVYPNDNVIVLNEGIMIPFASASTEKEFINHIKSILKDE